MKKFLVLVFLLFTLLSYSQVNKIDNKPTINIEQSKYFNVRDLGSFIGNTKTNIFYCDIRKDNLFLRVFNDKLELIDNKKHKLPKRYQNLEVIQIKKVDNKLVLISKFDNKKIEKTIIFKESFDFNSIKSEEDFKKIHMLDYIPDRNNENVWKSLSHLENGFRIDFMGKNIPGEWNMEIYKSGNNLGKVSLDISKIDGKISKLESLTSYNNDNELVIITKDYKNISEYRDVYLVNYNNYKEKVKTEIEKPNYSFTISFINLLATEASNQIIKQVAITASNKDFIKSLNISYLKDDKFLLTGALSKNSSSNANALFSKIISLEKIEDNMIIEDKYEFTNDFITQGMSDDEIIDMNLNKSKGLPYDYYNYKQINLLKTKNAYISVIEKVNNYITYENSGYENTSVEYTVRNRYYSDLFLMYLSDEGSVKDVIKIPKRQVIVRYSDIAPSSCEVKITDNNTLILIPDHQSKYANYWRRLKVYVIDNNTGTIKERELVLGKNIDKANFEFAKMWLDDYNTIVEAINEKETKVKIVKFGLNDLLENK